MNRESIARVQRSHEALTARAGDLTTRFYERLFEAEPACAPCFRPT